jgi:hypothetical protein
MVPRCFPPVFPLTGGWCEALADTNDVPELVNGEIVPFQDLTAKLEASINHEHRIATEKSFDIILETASNPSRAFDRVFVWCPY